MNNSKHEIHWIIFDLGGIIIPESGELINNEMSASLNISSRHLSGFTSSYKREMTIGRISLLEMYTELIRKLSLPVSPEDALKHHLAFYRQVCTKHNPDIIRIIEMLRKYFSVACLTNTEIEIADISRETGLFDYFDKAFLSTELGMQKPDREIYEKVAREIGCSPGEIILIDDKEENVQAAKDFGMEGILFQGAERLRIELSGSFLGLIMRY